MANWWVDDAELARALGQAGLPCAALDDDALVHAGADDVLVLHLATCSGGERATDYAGWDLLERLAGAHEGFPILLLLSCEPYALLARRGRLQERLGHFRRVVGESPRAVVIDLAEALADLPAALQQRAEVLRSFWTPERRWALHHDARSRSLEETCARLRHAFAPPRRAAVRILLGAVLGGDVEWAAAHPLLQGLLAPGEALDPACLQNLDAHLATVLPRATVAPRPRRPARILLVEDDDEGARAWAAVLGLLLDAWTRRGWLASAPALEWACDAASAVAAVCAAFEEGRPYEMVLLDYSLEAPEAGGHALRAIKSACPDLPVVVFSGHDDAAITRWCLSHGASDYFVKETASRAGRSSAGHHAVLRQMMLLYLEERSPWSSRGRLRQCWRRFSLLEPRLRALDLLVAEAVAREPQFTSADRARIPAVRVAWHLSQAMRFILEARHGGVERASHHAIIEAQNAFDHLVVAETACQARTRLMNYTWLQKRTYGRVRELREGFVDRSLAEQVCEFPWVAHPDRRALPADADLDIFEAFLELLERYFQRWEEAGRGELPAVPASERLGRGQPPRPRLSERRASHAEVAEMGAAEFLRGLDAYLAGPGQAEKRATARRRLLFLEDEPERGWAHALQRLIVLGWQVDVALPSLAYPEANLWQVDVVALGRAPCGGRLGGGALGPCPLSTELLDGYDLVLQDLCIPTVADGLALLEAVRAESRALPVVVLTAADETALLVEASRRGASDYFVKSRGGGTPLEGFRVFRTLLAEWMEAAGLESSLRRLASRVARVAAPARPLNPSAFRRSGSLQGLAMKMGCVSADPVEFGRTLPPALASMLESAWTLLARSRSPKSRPGAWLAEAFSPRGKGQVDGNLEVLAVECGRAVEACRETLMAMPAVLATLGAMYPGSTRDEFRGRLREWGARTSPWKSLPWPRYREVFEARHAAAHGCLRTGFAPDETLDGALSFVLAFLNVLGSSVL